MPKSTNAEVENRVNKVYELLVNSWNRYDIVQYSANNWGIESRQVDDYIAMAKTIIKENAQQTQEEYLEEAKNKMDDLYKKAMSQKDLRLCKDIEQTRNKILGYEKLSISHDVHGSLNKMLQDHFTNEKPG